MHPVSTDPSTPATSLNALMAPPRTTPRNGFPFQAQATSPANKPIVSPLAIPTKVSLDTTERAFFQLISPSASPRTVTVRACVPEFPPMPATTGRKMARMGKAAIVGS